VSERSERTVNTASEPSERTVNTASDGVAITVNGDPAVVAPGTTVAGLVADLGLEPRGVAIAVDGEVVTRRTWGDRPLAVGARVEVLTIAQGG
jgi:sulfur carrier protein